MEEVKNASNVPQAPTTHDTKLQQLTHENTTYVTEVAVAHGQGDTRIPRGYGLNTSAFFK